MIQVMTELLRSAGTAPGMAAGKEGITETLARPSYLCNFTSGSTDVT